MGYSEQYFALMNKNWLLKRRNICLSLLELLIPSLVFVGLAILKSVLPSSSFPATLHIEDGVVFSQVENFYNLRQTLVETDTYLAFYPPSVGKPIQDYLISNGIDATRILEFDSAHQLDTYISRNDYTTSKKSSKIYAAVEINDLEGPNYSYALRFNATTQNSILHSVDIPERPAYNIWQRAYDAQSWQSMEHRGFLLLQSVIDSYVLSKEGVLVWNNSGSSSYNNTMDSLEYDESLNRPFASSESSFFPTSAQQFDESMIISHQPFPTKSYKTSQFTTVVEQCLGVILTLTFIWPLTRVVASLVEEKELKLRQTFTIMGLSSSTIVVSWVSTYIIIFSIIAMLVTGVSFIGGVYYYSNPLYIFLFYFLFGMSVFSIGFFFSAFFSTSAAASTFSALAFLISFFVSYAITNRTSKPIRLHAYLLPTVALTDAAKAISTLENLQFGLTFNSLYARVNNVDVNSALCMLLVDIVSYFLLGLYFNAVVPSSCGIAYPWYFLCSPVFWCGTHRSRHKSRCRCFFRQSRYYGEAEPKIDTSSSHDDDYELFDSNNPPPDSSSLYHLPPIDPTIANEPDTKMEPSSFSQDVKKPATIQIHVANSNQLSPTSSMSPSQYTDPVYDPFVAVKGLSLDILLNNVIILLGENGAGKSTVFNMLTGVFAPTSGSCSIDGYDLFSDHNDIYRQQGVCFQHNVLYPELTVYEHMSLFAVIKGFDRRIIGKSKHAHIMELLNDVGLGQNNDNKIHAFTHQLSGGQKRKLGMAIAMLNNSKICYLDEISTGIDVNSQRDIWNIILRHRQGRVWVLTTHDMAEAAALGDTIAILAAGKLMAIGSPFYLKKQYGIGYTLTINKEIVTSSSPLLTSDELPKPSSNGHESSSKTHEPSSNMSSNSNPSDPIVNFMAKHYPFAVLHNNTGGEVSYRLPLSSAQSFSSLLSHIEQNKKQLHIMTYGLGVTSLTEVFLSATAQSTREAQFNNIKSPTTSLPSPSFGHLPETQHNDFHTLAIADQEAAQMEEKITHNEDIASIDDDLCKDPPINHLPSHVIFWRHFCALLYKRFTIARRDLRTAIWQLVIPALLLLTGLICIRLNVVPNYHSQKLDFSLYPHQSQVIYANYAGLRQKTSEHNFNSHIMSSEYMMDDSSSSSIISTFQNSSNSSFLGSFMPLSISSPFQYGAQSAEESDEGTWSPIAAVLYSLVRTTMRYDKQPFGAPVNIVTPYALQEWLNDTIDNRYFDQTCFGAFLIQEASNIAPNLTMINSQTQSTLNISVHFNTSAQTSLPVYMNTLANALLAAPHDPAQSSSEVQNYHQFSASNISTHPASSKLTADTTPSITAYNHPLPATQAELSVGTTALACVVTLPLAFVPAAFAAFIVQEREEGIKHLQMLSGVSTLVYWFANSVWEILNFIPSFATILFLLAVIPVGHLLDTFERAAIITLALLAFIIAVCPFTFILTYFFREPTNAQNGLLVFNMMTSTVLVIFTFLTAIVPSTSDVSKHVLRFLFRIFPGYCVGDIVAFIILRPIAIPEASSDWSGHVAGFSLLALIADFFIYVILLICVECWTAYNLSNWFSTRLRIIRRCSLSSSTLSSSSTLLANSGGEATSTTTIFEEPQDVATLRKDIQNGKYDNYEEYPIVLKGLRKVYPPVSSDEKPFVAVSNLFFPVQTGQVFGFLGVNGAGKSTTMKLLTGDIYPSEDSGDAILNGLSILHQSKQVSHFIGYCPQFDALLPLLTAREHLTLFAHIKCIHRSIVHKYVQQLLDKCGLNHLADRPAGTYSGGNRRRLQVAIALMGNRIVLVDEPSSGVDLGGRRQLWKLINNTMHNRAVILTTHFMEEAEALSTNIGIMASGRLQAYGVSQHLKDCYGQAYQLELQSFENCCESVHQWVMISLRLIATHDNYDKSLDTFEKSDSKYLFQKPCGLGESITCRDNNEPIILVEKYRNTLKYRLDKTKFDLPAIFAAIEQCKAETSVGIESYSVSDTSLDQIFISIMQKDEQIRRLNNGDRV